MSLLSWGNYPKVDNIVYKFDSQETLQQIINEHDELMAYGNGRSYGDSALSKNLIYVKPYNYFLGFDNESGILHCQAGVLLSEILEVFVPRGWFLSVTPGTKLITVGGAIASDVHGKNHHVLWTPSQGQFSPKLRCVSFCFLTQLFMLPFEQLPSPNTPQQVFFLRTTDVVVQSCKTQNIL